MLSSSIVRIIINSINILLILFILSSCTNSTKNKKNEGTQPISAEPGWNILFDGKTMENWAITEFGTQGPVQISEGSIVLGMGDGCTGVTWQGDFPKINYEVKLQAKKIAGNDFFCGITFPVKETYCSFIVGGWGGPVAGLSSIDGRDASENETRTLKKFDHNIWYDIHLKVSENKIEAWIDKEQIVNFNTEGHKLSTRPEVDLSKPFGICSWTTTAAIKNIRIKTMTF
ncbi:MAG TPA: DUF1080 domain-containing protein [Mariniphaga sp.]|nr:DUF1080 domain-containing protein [Mariniphaga sp.]